MLRESVGRVINVRFYFINCDSRTSFRLKRCVILRKPIVCFASFSLLFGSFVRVFLHYFFRNQFSASLMGIPFRELMVRITSTSSSFFSFEAFSETTYSSQWSKFFFFFERNLLYCSLWNQLFDCVISSGANSRFISVSASSETNFFMDQFFASLIQILLRESGIRFPSSHPFFIFSPVLFQDSIVCFNKQIILRELVFHPQVRPFLLMRVLVSMGSS